MSDLDRARAALLKAAVALDDAWEAARADTTVANDLRCNLASKRVLQRARAFGRLARAAREDGKKTC